MLEIMLCGAEDTEQVRAEFVQVVKACGGEPLHFLSGDVRYINSPTSSFTENSRATVQDADVCVFVVVERFGTITWETELRTALAAGVPFVLLCLANTYAKYLTLMRSIDDLSAVKDESDRRLVEALHEAEALHHLTIVPFERNLFADVLRRQIAALFAQAVQLVQERNRRRMLAPFLYAPSELSAAALSQAAEIVRDEFEDKAIRKRALLALADRAACDEETLVAALNSVEQGVQRLAFRELHRLYAARPPESQVLEDVVAIANSSDDLGLVRRLIPELFHFGAAAAVQALESLEVTEIGTRRRLAAALEDAESDIVVSGVGDTALRLARRCEDGVVPTDWKARLRDLIGRLESQCAGPGPV